MKSGTLHTMSELLRGKSLARIQMNDALRGIALTGKVVDVGGGRRPDYFSYFDTKHVSSIEPVDGSLSQIDFEKDPLPYESGTVDTVVLCNTLEHVYNHNFLVQECARIMKPTGTLVGFVPFFVGYHPDPHDYFRYTKEALVRICEAHFERVSVEEVGGGPFIASCNTVCLSFPKWLRPLLYVWHASLDALFLSIRPQARMRTPLGYVFKAHTPHA